MRTYAVTSDKLSDYLPDNGDAMRTLSYESGEFALQVTVSEIRYLARHRQVVGIARRDGTLKSIRLVVSIKAALRTLAACVPESRHKVTKSRTSAGAKEWAPHYDRAKLGIFGATRRVTHTPMASVMAAVPGMMTRDLTGPLVVVRRIVG